MIGFAILAFSATLESLCLYRDSVLLIENLQLAVNSGDLVHIQGPNGSGKTTLLRSIAGLYSDYSGNIRFNDDTPLLYIGHKPSIHSSLTAYENLRWLMTLAGFKISQSQALTALDSVGLYSYEHTPAFELSAGQQRRVALAQLFLRSDAFWVLDEPFTSLDQQAISMFEQLMLNHTQNNGIVCLSSHQMLSVGSQSISLDDYLPEHPL